MLQEGVALLFVAGHGGVGTGLVGFVSPALFSCVADFPVYPKQQGAPVSPVFPGSGQTGARSLPE